MKATELMIGDWVNFLVDTVGGETREDSMTNEYQPMQIVSLSSWRNNDGDVESAEGVINDIDQLNPIPLTPEILEKNGFTGGEYVSYIGDVWYLKQEEFVELVLTVSHNTAILWGKKKLGYPYSNSNNFLISNIHSVHELQHALKLCGINKEIEI